MRLDSALVAYWSLMDPLCQSQVLPVLRGLAADGYRLGLMTFEQRRWKLAPVARRAAKMALAVQGIDWIPRRYHAWPPTVSTLVDIVAGARQLMRRRPRLVHGRGSVPAAAAYLASRGGRSLFLNDADGPLSKEYVDVGIWKPDSLVAQAVERAERAFFDAADASAVLTSSRAAQVAKEGQPAPTILPCAVETEFFRANPDARERLRRALSLDGTVFVYAGKMGGWYLVEPMIDFVAAYQRLGERASLLVLTPSSPEPFERAAARRGVDCRVTFASREHMPGHLSAADVGLSFILPAPSKRACSPVKNGEYLACGLPVVTTAGIGDYSELVSGQRVGVVVNALDAGTIEGSAGNLRELMREGAALRTRCRQAACSHAGLTEIVLPRYRQLYGGLLGGPGTRH
jgi:glycosyltransferase involved in cell wall biosynthesis